MSDNRDIKSDNLAQGMTMSRNTPIKKQHMSVNWHEIVRTDSDVPAVSAPIKEKTSMIGRIGSMMLAVGTSAWRVRAAMNRVSRAIGVSCNIDIGLKEISFTLMQNGNHYSQTISVPTTGVNTDKIRLLEEFMVNIEDNVSRYSVEQFHQMLDRIESVKPNYNAVQLGLAAGAACCAFTFLLGGGIIEMICAFIGAGLGNLIRKLMLERKLSLLINVAAGVAISCLSYVLSVRIAELLFGIDSTHHAGYICAMLFIIPGFPLITGGIDLAKLDLRSGIERITYAIIIIGTATLIGWVAATAVNFNPDDFLPQNLSYPVLTLLRIITGFVGVFGFSMMFNSTYRMAATAGVIGSFANIVRFLCIDYLLLKPGVAAFIGAFTAGMIASVLHKRQAFPRISITVPSVVIMVPGMFMYKGIYYLGLYDVVTASEWLSKALLIVVALPLGLIFARFVTDREFRHCS